MNSAIASLSVQSRSFAFPISRDVIPAFRSGGDKHFITSWEPETPAMLAIPKDNH